MLKTCIIYEPMQTIDHKNDHIKKLIYLKNTDCPRFVSNLVYFFLLNRGQFFSKLSRNSISVSLNKLNIELFEHYVHQGFP